MPDFDYQLVVIGSGPGGYVAAIRASQLGLKTAIVEKDKTLGGTCLNVGCIPSKALLASTEHLHFAKERFAAHGIITGEIKVDLGAMMKRKGEVVGKLTGGVAYLMKKNKIDVVKGLGKLVDGNTVEVTDEGGAKKTLKTQNILLATGSVPVELPFLKFDGKRVISSDQGIALDKVPKTMLVIGAGAIGLELGSVWARLGAEVTVIEFLPRIAAVGFDAETSKILQRNLEKLGMKFELSTKIESAKVTDKGVELQGVKGDAKVSYSAEIVLVAVGRKPNTENIGLDKLKVELDLIYDAITKTKREIAVLHGNSFNGEEMAKVNGELGAVVGGTEEATQQILEAAEAIDNAATALAKVTSPDQQKILSEEIQERVVSIFEACNFQDLTGQRIAKVMATLNFVEDHVTRVLEEIKNPTAARRDGAQYLHGPRLDTDSGHVSQADIDEMFSGNN